MLYLQKLIASVLLCATGLLGNYVRLAQTDDDIYKKIPKFPGYVFQKEYETLREFKHQLQTLPLDDQKNILSSLELDTLIPAAQAQYAPIQKARSKLVNIETGITVSGVTASIILAVTGIACDSTALATIGQYGTMYAVVYGLPTIFATLKFPTPESRVCAELEKLKKYQLSLMKKSPV